MLSRPVCPDAAALIRGGADFPQLVGEIQFFQECGRVLVLARLSGFPRETSDFFAMHIHDGESCSGTDFSGTGGHYNPSAEAHPYHAGDLPPLMSCLGSAFLAVRTARFRVCDIIGKTVVIHNAPDDFRSQPAGNSGTKIACGVIRRK